jgi:hypothetical protein
MVLGLGIIAFPVAASAGACGPKDPQGRYDGEIKGSEGTVVETTMNLRCDAGQYSARFFTGMGDFLADDASMADGRLVVKFNTGGAAGVITFTPSGPALNGVADIAGDKATANLRRVGEAWTEAQWTPHLNLTTAQWREDLAALARDLPKRHANAFAFLPKAEFERRVADLDRRIPSMSADEVFVGLLQLVNSIGDGHTTIVSPPDRENMPLELTLIGGEFRVTAAGAGLEKALGAQVVAIDDTPIAEAHRRALTLTPTQELPELREGRVVFFLARGLTLHGLGITHRRDRAIYKLRDDAGKTFTVEAKGLGTVAEAPMTSLHSKSALRYQNPNADFWCKPLPDAKAVYCAWRAYPHLHENAQAMFALIDQTEAEKLILDMRDNGGGDNTVGYAELVKPLAARADLNRKDRLYILIGPLTFSAAMNNAAQFQDQTNATLVGQTIGEKPNSYQEPRSVRLPNSRLNVRVSTLYYEFRKTGENAVRPTREIIPTWADVKAGRDPELEWVLAQP